jgi:hypothetical protein
MRGMMLPAYSMLLMLLLLLLAAGAASYIDAHKKQLSYVNAALLASVPWMQVGRQKPTFTYPNRNSYKGHSASVRPCCVLLVALPLLVPVVNYRARTRFR